MKQEAMLGCGLMGLAYLKQCHEFPDIIIDNCEDNLLKGREICLRRTNKEIIFKNADLMSLDLSQFTLSHCLLFLHTALAEKVIEKCINLGIDSISVARPDYGFINEKNKHCLEKNVLAIYGVGLEPGLIELLAKKYIDDYPQLAELNIKCGGIPRQKDGKLNYKRFFGGKELPFELRPTYKVENFSLEEVARFSDVEFFNLPGLGDLEAYNDALIPHNYSGPNNIFCNLKNLTQKTIRWSGYTNIVNTLHKLDFLSDERIFFPQTKHVTSKEFTFKVLEKATEVLPEDEDVIIIGYRGYDANSNELFNIFYSLEGAPELNLLAMEKSTIIPYLRCRELLLENVSKKGFLALHEFLGKNHSETFLKEILGIFKKIKN